MPQIALRSFALPKSGNAIEEWEDSLYALAAPARQRDLRFAIADGATGATFSGLWARLLCTEWGAGMLTEAHFLEHLPQIGREWQRRVDAEPLPWYAEAKAREGSFAAFLGFSLDAETGHWRALAVGDCTLIQTSTKENLRQVQKVFPYTRASDFSSAPALVAVYPTANANLSAHIRVEEGTALPGDHFYLMTDALAAWCLRELEEERMPWRWLDALGDAPAGIPFEDFVGKQRELGKLHNDDTTLITLKIT